jgi:hypothetical protein
MMFLWFLILAGMLCLVLAFGLGWVCCLARVEKAADAPVWPEEDERLEDDAFARQLSAWLDEDDANERLAAASDWGPMPELDRADRDGPPDNRTTGELRALAYTGNVAALVDDAAAYMASLEEGDAES